MKTIFAMRLKSAMEQAHLNQAELSAKTGIGKSGISQYLSSTNIPTNGARLSALAEALGVTVGYLQGEGLPPASVPVGLANLKIGLKAASRCIGKSEAFLRSWLLSGNCPFGTAIQGSGSRVNPYINPEKFRDYVGAARFDVHFDIVCS